MKKSSLSLIMIGTLTLAFADGASLYKKCSVCHGEQAEKKSLGVSAVIAGWKQDAIVSKLKAYKSKKLNQYGFGNMMSGQAVKLDDAQMREVAAYISKLKPAQSDAGDNNASAGEVLTPEQMEYKQFVRDYFAANPNGNIREADKLWAEKNSKK